MSRIPSFFSPERMSSWVNSAPTRDGSRRIVKSRIRGCEGSSMLWSEMRLNTSTGAPRFSAPNDGKHMLGMPSLIIASVRNCPALTAPCPARECHLIANFSVIFIGFSLRVLNNFTKKRGRAFHV